MSRGWSLDYHQNFCSELPRDARRRWCVLMAVIKKEAIRMLGRQLIDDSKNACNVARIQPAQERYTYCINKVCLMPNYRAQILEESPVSGQDCWRSLISRSGWPDDRWLIYNMWPEYSYSDIYLELEKWKPLRRSLVRNWKCRIG